MNATTDLQQQFFSHLKSSLPPHISMVDELTELLKLSYDSVYRRIRGEKPLALNELRHICDHYHISLDQVLQLQNDTVVFKAPDMDKEHAPFSEMLKSYLFQLRYVNSFQKREMLYLCKDLPIWHFYLFPEIGAFKTFFWMKTIQNLPEYRDKQFSLSDFPFADCFALGQQVINEYNQMPSTELWNFEVINSTISQIKFYIDGGFFKDESDIGLVIDSFDKSLEHLRYQAEKGVKFMPGSSDVAYKAPVQLYINEVVIGNNTILAEVNDTKIAFIPYNVFSYLITRDARFNQSAFHNFQTLVSRSTLVSGTGEKERNRLFRLLKERVQNLKR